MRAWRARVAALLAVAGGAAVIACGPGSAVPAVSHQPGPVTRAGASTGAANIAVQDAAANRAAKARVYCPALPRGGLKLNPRFPLPRPPRGATVTHPAPSLGCAYLVGYADVRKLNGASLVGPGLANLAIGDRVVYNFGVGYFEADSAGELDYQPCRTCRVVHGLPPARATFLAFGFMPVSATLQLTEIGTVNIITVGTSSSLGTNTAWSLMELRVYDVDVNGQPLNVGPHCQTKQAVLVKLIGLGTGTPPYSLQRGGPLTGYLTIPPFEGCGVTENLDPLFTGTVSGPGNYALFTQGPVCAAVGGPGCPASPPKPLR